MRKLLNFTRMGIIASAPVLLFRATETCLIVDANFNGVQLYKTVPGYTNNFMMSNKSLSGQSLAKGEAMYAAGTGSVSLSVYGEIDTTPLIVGNSIQFFERTTFSTRTQAGAATIAFADQTVLINATAANVIYEQNTYTSSTHKPTVVGTSIVWVPV